MYQVILNEKLTVGDKKKMFPNKEKQYSVNFI